MPSLKKKVEEEVLVEPDREELLQLIRESIKEVEDNPEDEELKRRVTCSFFKQGNFPRCKNCIQHKDTVDEHFSWYVAIMQKNPQPKWYAGIEDIKPDEEIVHVDTVSAIGTHCDECYISKHCPKYRSGSICTIDWTPDVNTKEPQSVYGYLIKIQLDRISKARKFEELDGGVPDANLSNEMDRLERLLKGRVDIMSDKFSIKLEASGSSPQREGILSKLFSGVTGNSLPEHQKQETVEGVFEEVKEPQKINLKK